MTFFIIAIVTASILPLKKSTTYGEKKVQYSEKKIAYNLVGQGIWDKKSPHKSLTDELQ